MAEGIQFKRTRDFLFGLRAGDVQSYRIGDDLSGLLVFLMVVFSPWAFGTTQPWSVWAMDFAGYALGILLLAKLFIRRARGYPAPRWENFSGRSRPVSRPLVKTLAWLTLAVLAYCLASAVNARSTFNPDTKIFEYHRCLAWLPHSLDSHRSWLAFWNYLGLACSFWGVRDWLAGMTSREVLAVRADAAKPPPLLPARLRRLLWWLCLNGLLLAVEGIVQRAVSSDRLLFLVQPRVNPEGETQFGAYAYRSNAAQYFNLLWPVCLGFWWTLQRAGGSPHKRHHLLLLCAAVMAACPLISGSRGGALVAGAILLFTLVFSVTMNHSSAAGQSPAPGVRRGTAGWFGLFFATALLLGWYFGWDLLSARMMDIQGGFQNREEIYDSARPMAADYPVFGTGPGTFATVFQLYRISSATYWPEQLHNDWLETRITFGWAGMALVLAALACIGGRWFAPGGTRGSRRFVALAWVALAGCLVHARFDFPFQIHSTIFLFLVICAMLFNLSRRSGAARH